MQKAVNSVIRDILDREDMEIMSLVIFKYYYHYLSYCFILVQLTEPVIDKLAEMERQSVCGDEIGGDRRKRHTCTANSKEHVIR